MRSNPIIENVAQAGLSISELAERTGVPAATLRSWEARYGAPYPRRLAGGRRRYAEDDVTLVEQILRQRAQGLSLQTSIDRAAAHVDEPEPSVFAGLRRRHPDLTPQVLSKATLLALTRAIEDECCARAEHPVLFATFQRQHFYRRSRSRWAELARTAEVAVVFADFTEASGKGILPVEVPLPPAAPARREWVLVCDAPDYPACLAAWEHLGQDTTAEPERRFETLWTVDPSVVRDAARICAGFTVDPMPHLGHALAERLTGTPPGASADLRRAAGLLDRMIGYLENARK